MTMRRDLVVVSLVLTVQGSALAAKPSDGPMVFAKTAGKLVLAADESGNPKQRCKVGDQVTPTTKTKKAFETYVDDLPDGTYVRCLVMDVDPGVTGECRAFKLSTRRCTTIPAPTPAVTPTPGVTPSPGGPCCGCGCAAPAYEHCPFSQHQCSVDAPGATTNDDCDAYDIPGELDCEFLTACNTTSGGIFYPYCTGLE